MEENRHQSHKTLIRNILMAGKTITALEALRDLGCYRLGARISELRSEGMMIDTVMEQSISRITGEPVRFASYSLSKNIATPEAVRGQSNQ